MTILNKALLAVAVGVSSLSASAETYRYSFEAKDFILQYGAPIEFPEKIAGSFDITYDPVADRLTKLIGIDLEILGHRYSISGVEFQQSMIGDPLVGGGKGDLFGMDGDKHDFVFFGSVEPYFSFTTEGQFGFYHALSVSVTRSVVETPPVPEPGAVVLLASGLGLVGVALHKKSAPRA